MRFETKVEKLKADAIYRIDSFFKEKRSIGFFFNGVFLTWKEIFLKSQEVVLAKWLSQFGTEYRNEALSRYAMEKSPFHTGNFQPSLSSFRLK